MTEGSGIKTAEQKILGNYHRWAALYDQWIRELLGFGNSPFCASKKRRRNIHKNSKNTGWHLITPMTNALLLREFMCQLDDSESLVIVDHVDPFEECPGPWVHASVTHVPRCHTGGCNATINWNILPWYRCGGEAGFSCVGSGVLTYDLSLKKGAFTLICIYLWSNYPTIFWWDTCYLVLFGSYPYWRLLTCFYVKDPKNASRCKAIMLGSRWSTNKLLFFSCKGLGGWNMVVAQHKYFEQNTFAIMYLLQPWQWNLRKPPCRPKKTSCNSSLYISSYFHVLYFP